MLTDSDRSSILVVENALYKIRKAVKILNPYPLRFEPVFKERIWGGKNLEKIGLQLPSDKIGESWMIADHLHGTTIVTNGPLAGHGMDQIRDEFGTVFFGEGGVSQKNGRFPILIKLLDCNDDVSVQVHPDNDYVKLSDGELGKTEMWYVLESKPGASIIFGLHPGVDRAKLERAIRENRIMDCLRRVPVKQGDAFYFPAGTVHALSAGVVVAEIQQNSDTTYRLYDYERPGLDGKLRELHIEDALNVITYDDSTAAAVHAHSNQGNQWVQLVQSPYFVVEKGCVQDTWTQSTPSYHFEVIVIIEGSGSLSWTGGSMEVKLGECYLLPANLGEYTLEGSLTLLKTRLP